MDIQRIYDSKMNGPKYYQKLSFIYATTWFGQLVFKSSLFLAAFLATFSNFWMASVDFSFIDQDLQLALPTSDIKWYEQVARENYSHHIQTRTKCTKVPKLVMNITSEETRNTLFLWLPFGTVGIF